MQHPDLGQAQPEVGSMGPSLPQGSSVSPGTAVSPEIPFFSPPAVFILYLCLVIKAPDFLSSAPCLSLWNPISGLILLCLGSMPLSLSFLLLLFPSFWAPVLSQSCLSAGQGRSLSPTPTWSPRTWDLPGSDFLQEIREGASLQ